MAFRPTRALLALSVAAALIGSACDSGSPARGPSSAPSNQVVKGGSVVLGAEQWPQCLNPITSCANALWLYYAALYYVTPRAMQLDTKGNFVASPLLSEAPTFENGGITQSPFTVTFKINPKAVWADGTPITSADFAFTLDAIMHTRGTVSTVGYDQISTIDTSDPHTAVLKFKQVYVDWPDLFGGAFGFVLEKAAFPAENTKTGHVNLASEMSDSLPFSGGPWVLKSWSKQQAVFVRNSKFWDHQPNLDQITMVPREDQTTEINSLLSGEVSAIYPQPSNVSLLKQFQTNPNVKSVGGDGVSFEALWFNLSKAPLNDPKVRQALMYAVDRQAIVDAIVKLNNPNGEVLNCGFVSFPNIGSWCQGANGQPFTPFHYDADMVSQILTSDGYTKGSNGYFQKDGKDLTIVWSTVAGNARRETTQALEIEKAKAAGIKLTVKNYEATDLFSNKLPRGDFVLGEYAQGGSPDPSITAILACDQIPTAANSFSGANYNRWCNQQATQLMKQSDQDLDVQKRLQDLQQVYGLQAQDFVSLPLYVLPAVSAWRADKLTGPIGQYNSSIYGLFFNMDQWSCAQAGACS
jgi:peptide/nickel transport system substrate-binding protein